MILNDALSDRICMTVTLNTGHESANVKPFNHSLTHGKRYDRVFVAGETGTVKDRAAAAQQPVCCYGRMSGHA